MKNNLGSFDQGARFILGCVILFLGIENIGWWGLLGLIPWLTSIVGYCPLYHLLGIDSARWEKKWESRHPPIPPKPNHHP
jgi:hypothetical protein